MDEMRGESSRVAELVPTGGNGQGHGEVVALCKSKQQVLHGGAGCFVGLEENHIGKLDPWTSGDRGAAKVEGLYFPVPVSSLVQQQTDCTEDHKEQKDLLLPHFHQICAGLSGPECVGAEAVSPAVGASLSAVGRRCHGIRTLSFQIRAWER